MTTRLLMALLLGLFFMGPAAALASDDHREHDHSHEYGAAEAAEGVEHSKVCMVQNRVSPAMKMIPVEVEGKTYYGCCQGCVGKIKFNRSVRFSNDPSTGKEVDKARAYIVSRQDGTVLYFESEATARAFQASGGR